MASTTSRVSLYKPAGGEDVNVTTDLNNNLDKLDTNLNFRVVANAAARNAVSPYWEGLNVRETDTGKLYVSNGSSPASGSWKQIPVADASFDSDLDLASGKQINIGSSTSTASLAVVNATVDTDVISARISGDTTSRFILEADGEMNWSAGGSGAVDVDLLRLAPQVLGTSVNFAINQAGAGLRIKEGSNAKMGTATLNGTTDVVVSTTAVTANSRIFLTTQASSATYGCPVVVSRSAGVSFTIKSTAASDTSTVAWMIIEPA